MIKRIVLISLAIALVLSAVAPATALAKKWRPTQRPVVQRFAVIMTPTTIDSPVISSAPWPNPVPPGANAWPIVDMIDVEGVPTPAIVGWVVGGRSIYGGVTGDMGGSFTFTYGGILDTLQSGSIQGIVTIQTARGIVYLAAQGTSEAEVTGVYTFAEIKAWVLAALGLPVVGPFFAEIYNNPDLALLPDEVLAGYYGSLLPPLPKTLSAEFSGTVRVDAGTGAFGSVSGSGRFKPAGGNPLTLQVWPSQHVYAIDGAIQLTGTYSRRSLEGAFEFDREKLRGLIEKWREQHEDD